MLVFRKTKWCKYNDNKILMLVVRGHVLSLIMKCACCTTSHFTPVSLKLSDPWRHCWKSIGTLLNATIEIIPIKYLLKTAKFKSISVNQIRRSITTKHCGKILQYLQPVSSFHPKSKPFMSSFYQLLRCC